MKENDETKKLSSNFFKLDALGKNKLSSKRRRFNYLLPWGRGKLEKRRRLNCLFSEEGGKLPSPLRRRGINCSGSKFPNVN
jgi:hypothetical protein